MNRAKPGEIRPIDRTNPVPYYHQLFAILKEEIERGRWEPQELIPSEGELTVMFGVSRSVTRKALDLLEGQGHVFRIKGKGTVVANPKFSYEAAGTAATWSLDRSTPARLGEIVSAGRVAVGGHLGKLMDLSPGENVWEITLTHTIDRAVVSVSQVYLKIQGTLALGAPPEFEGGGPDFLHQLATKFALEVHESDLQIESGRTTPRESQILGVATDEPVFVVSSLDRGAGGQVVGFSRTVVRPGHFFLAVSIRHRLAMKHQGMPGLGLRLAESVS
jgi:GntR family transcriptional regulator